MRKTARKGGSRGSNGVSEHLWFTRESPEKKMELEGNWRGGEQQEGIVGELGSGMAARGLPSRAAAIYGVMEIERASWDARRGEGGLYL